MDFDMVSPSIALSILAVKIHSRFCCNCDIKTRNTAIVYLQSIRASDSARTVKHVSSSPEY